MKYYINLIYYLCNIKISRTGYVYKIFREVNASKKGRKYYIRK